jgi:hypothetical protein
MASEQSHTGISDGMAFLIGCGAGICGGLLLGGCFVWLSGAYFNGMWMIVIMHAIFAMVLMGAWLAPTLLCHEKKEIE